MSVRFRVIVRFLDWIVDGGPIGPRGQVVYQYPVVKCQTIIHLYQNAYLFMFVYTNTRTKLSGNVQGVHLFCPICIGCVCLKLLSIQTQDESWMMPEAC